MMVQEGGHIAGIVSCVVRNVSTVRVPNMVCFGRSNQTLRKRRTIGSTGAAGRAVSEIKVGWPRPGDARRYPARFTGFKQSYEMAI